VERKGIGTAGLHMTNFIPHDEYTKFVETQMRRIRAKSQEWSKEQVGRIAMALAGGAGLAVLVGMIPMGGALATFFRLGVMAAAAYFIYSIATSKYTDQFTCPHCEKQFSLTTPYICGDCGHTEHIAPARAYDSITEMPRFNLDPCPQCNSSPHSMMCPSCGNDIVLDLEQYSKADKLGFGFVGTRKIKKD
jgi:hypothetical protein